MKLIAQNFLGLSRVAWEPRDVSLVVGPNGSGKTSLLQAFGFLRRAWSRSVPKAVAALGGVRGLKHLGANAEEPVMIGLEVGESRWELELTVQGGALGDYPAERVTIGDKVVLQRRSMSSGWTFADEYFDDLESLDDRTCLREAFNATKNDTLRPLAEALGRLMVYSEKWSVPRLWDTPLSTATETVLNISGRNLFSVLANWRTAPRRHGGKYDWVARKARDAFYDIFDDLEIEPLGDGISARFFRPNSEDSLPIRRAADGLIVGLLHLTAVAGAPEGSLVAIDEMENQLHPHAIRVILEAMRERAEERDLTVVLTTHSPVLMDQFADHLDNFFVTEPGRPETPVRLDAIHDRRYLAQFALGDLYERLKFGAPRSPG